MTDILPAQITSATWTCVSGPNPATKCDAAGTGNINDTVNLAAGESVIYTVNAVISPSAAGVLSNTATVTIPSGYLESDLMNNTATDSNSPPAGAEPNIGPPDGTAKNPGTTPPDPPLVMVFSPGLVANGDVGTPDLVYYEVIFSGSSINLDNVRIEISANGSSWIPIFEWGDGAPDTNTNVDLALVGDICQVGGVPGENDNCAIPDTRLYNTTGITIDIDAIGVPAGNYPWMRITGTGIDGPDVDAIQLY